MKTKIPTWKSKWESESQPRTAIGYTREESRPAPQDPNEPQWCVVVVDIISLHGSIAPLLHSLSFIAILPCSCRFTGLCLSSGDGEDDTQGSFSILQLSKALLIMHFVSAVPFCVWLQEHQEPFDELDSRLQPTATSCSVCRSGFY